FAFPKPGNWQIKAEAADNKGRIATSTANVWIWEDGYDWQGSYRDLEAEFDKKIYKPGETARLIVRSPITGGNLLISLEGRNILSHRTVPLKSMVEVVEIPVTEKYAPYIYLSAITVGNGRFYNRTIPLKVDYQPDKLNISVKTDKLQYAPGDTVHMTVSSNVADKPVSPELSLAVVDESIFAIAPERSDDIYKFFIGTRDHLVNTMHSFTNVYLGGAAKGLAGVMNQADDPLKGLKVRKTFKDTAFWSPILKNNPDGAATAEFTLPDNLTTWRATAIGHTTDSEFGTARDKFIAKLDLMARLSPPRFFTVGDKLQVPGVINNTTDFPLEVKGRFEAKGLTLLSENSFTGQVSPQGNLRKDVLLKAEQTGNATLTLLAQGSDQQNKRGDAMELTIPVLIRGIKRTDDGGIVLHEEKGEIETTLPDSALPNSALLKINFAPTIATGLNSAINKLIDFPYGCVEQTLSRFVPAVYAESLLKEQAWQPDPATEAKLPQVIADGLKRLADMQHDDGGWGWWKNDATSITMTSYALYSLGLAKEAGLSVPTDMVDRGLGSLTKQIQNAPLTDIPRAYRAMAINGKNDEAIEKKIMSAWDKLPLAEQLAFTEALIFSNRKEEAIPLLTLIKRKVQYEGRAAYIRDEDADSWWYGWRWGSSAVETTASLLSQFIKLDPDNPLNPKLAEFLARRKTGGWWQTTASSAASVIALANYAAATGESKGNYSAGIAINGNNVAKYKVENGALTSGNGQISIPATSIKPGINRIEISKSGSGTAYISTSLEYAVAPDENHSSDGMALERRMYKVKAVKDNNNWRLEYTPLKEGDPVYVGEDIEVRLTVTNKKPLEYVVIEDRLPAGFEVRETDSDPRFMDDSFYLDWYTQRERHDDRMAFFITSLDKGSHEFRYMIYPELKGNVIALPATFWPMYQPEIRGESKPWQIDILPGK
ncbi:MAG: hypothetical protein FWD70_03495, partial [Desulfuromonadales bacterium]|nr:hypothetical protein [Desulfuromonadales bacterium]